MSNDADISRGPDRGNAADNEIEENAAQHEQNQARELALEQPTPSVDLAQNPVQGPEQDQGLGDLENQEIAYGMHLEGVVERTTGMDVDGANLEKLTEIVANLPKLACCEANAADLFVGIGGQLSEFAQDRGNDIIHQV